jgi:hypothetical protein
MLEIITLSLLGLSYVLDARDDRKHNEKKEQLMREIMTAQDQELARLRKQTQATRW